MPEPLPADYLQRDESTVLAERRHPFSVVDELVSLVVLWSIVVVGTAVFVFGFRPDLLLLVGVPVWAAVTGLALSVGVSRWWRTTTSLYTLTDARVYESYGRLRWTLTQTTFDKITDLHVRQGIFGRRFGYGTIRLMTAGTGLHLVGVRRPFAVKQAIEEARTAFLERLVEENAASIASQMAPALGSATGGAHTTTGMTAAGGQVGPAAAGQQVPTTTASGAAAVSHPASQAPRRIRSGMGAQVWQGRPATGAVVGAMVGAGLMALVGVSTAVGSLAADAVGFALFGAGLVILSAINMGRAIVLVRYTRYWVHEGGVVVTSGWLTRRRVEATYGKVTDVQTTQGVLGRMLGFGEIRVNTAGSNEAPIVFFGVVDPERVKAIVDQARGAA